MTGAAYTFEDGKSLTAEYLHDGHGYTADEESAYFERAVTLPGMALGLAPRLLGRDYLHMVWQSNMMGEIGYWRLMYTRNFTDGGNELAAYGETVLALAPVFLDHRFRDEQTPQVLDLLVRLAPRGLLDLEDVLPRPLDRHRQADIDGSAQGLSV